MSNYDSRQSTQGGTFVNLMRDSGFKAVYADKDNKQLLIELLNFFLPEDVKVSDIKAYLDREQDPEVESGKRTYLDLVCQGEDGSIFSVEVQQEGEKWIFERCMYYGCDIYRNQISSGDYYSELKPLYIICILGKNFPHQNESEWDENNLISHYKFTETRTKEFAPSTIIINFVETARFTKALEACESPCDYLLYWFLNGWKYDVNGIPEVLKDIPEVKQLSAACEIAAFSPAKRALYNRSVMREQDVINQLYYAKEKGLAEGRKEGREEGLAEGKTEERLEIAKKMLDANSPIDFICQMTGLSEEEVLKLKTE